MISEQMVVGQKVFFSNKGYQLVKAGQVIAGPCLLSIDDEFTAYQMLNAALGTVLYQNQIAGVLDRKVSIDIDNYFWAQISGPVDNFIG